MATQQEIQDAINALTSSSLFEDMLLLAIDTNDITQDRVIVVNTVNDLPDLSLGKVSRGTMFFVDEIKVVVIATHTKWLGLDSRLLRRDFYEDTARAWGITPAIGDNTGATKTSPVSVAGGFTDWCQVSSSRHSLGIRQNGTAWAWGFGGSGQLGDGTTVSKSSPVSVVGGFTDWCQVSAGFEHSVGIRTNGTMWSWGQGTIGALGDGTTVGKLSPVSVVGGFDDWCQVSAGSGNSLAVRRNGTAWGWGCNICGTLGDGTTVAKSSPVSVLGGFTDWCQVSVGFCHGVGVRQNGTLWAWGANNCGSLGDGTTVAKSSPVLVAGGFTDWCQVSAGKACVNLTGSHNLGLRTNGTIWAWGGNSSGQLGDGTQITTVSPVSVIGGFTDWCQVSAGWLHSLAVRTNGTAWAWGAGCNGILGDSTTSNKCSPISVVGGLNNWCQVAAGCSHSLGITSCL